MVTQGGSSEFLPGAVGPFADSIRPITEANIRPYLVALLLHKHSVSLQDLVAIVQPNCPSSDFKIGFYDCLQEDMSRLEILCLNVIDEFVRDDLLRYNKSSNDWSLSAGEGNSNLAKIVGWVSLTGGQVCQRTIQLFTNSNEDSEGRHD